MTERSTVVLNKLEPDKVYIASIALYWTGTMLTSSLAFDYLTKRFLHA